MKKDKIFAIACFSSFIVAVYLIFSGFGFYKIDALADTASTTATIVNAAPTIGTFTINGGDASITLTEGDITSVVASTTVTVTDDNGCEDISTTTANFYRTDKTSSCSANLYDCYTVAYCSVVGSGNTCDGSSDTSADYECSVTLTYYTDPTDDNASASSTEWTMLVTADDGDDTGTNTDTIEVSSLNAIDLTTPIAYGSLSLGASSTNQEQTITNTGNVRLDMQFSGTDMTCTAGSVVATQQKYGTSTISVWGDAPYALSTSPTETDWDVAKRTGATSTSAVHWMLQAPSSGADGSCSGTNTLTAVNDDVTAD